MTNRWQELWNGRKINFDALSSEDEQTLVLELKRIVGWDFHGKKSSVTFDEFRREYAYIKSNLGFDGKYHVGGGYLKSVAAAVPISTFSSVTALRSAALITRKICSTSPGKLSAQKI